MRKVLVVLFIAQVMFSFAQDKKGCTEKSAIKQVMALDEVARHIKEGENTPNGIFFMSEDGGWNDRDYYVVKEMMKGKFMSSTLQFFYVDKVNCQLYYYYNEYEVLFSPRQWKVFNNDVFGQGKNNKVHFMDLFFTYQRFDISPKDLIRNNEVINEFKVDLNSFEEKYRKAGKFEVDYLLLFINNTSTEASKRLLNTEWLKYFIKQFTIEVSRLNTLMKEAIENGDLKAIEYFIRRGYILSDIELSVVKRAKERSSSKSLITIEKLLNVKYAANKISDPDGYTNLRDGKGINTNIITQIQSGEHIRVLDNISNWLLIETESGQRGYVYRNRVKSE
ncbi:SH3 domain-containing protein [Myroides odoratimimus]|uniref:SH3 domain-containing protein n=1 Tax=Myroides odoratimimus TaxID=76832 RepID=UPI00091A8B11|nr:SH3 domain-containing protein [Myroides odoratimimus]SHK95432.1 SH3 domain-containing protein [Myroides odoratimimus subsp. xuanwuensis]